MSDRPERPHTQPAVCSTRTGWDGRNRNPQFSSTLLTGRDEHPRVCMRIGMFRGTLLKTRTIMLMSMLLSALMSMLIVEHIIELVNRQVGEHVDDACASMLMNTRQP